MGKNVYSRVGGIDQLQEEVDSWVTFWASRGFLNQKLKFILSRCWRINPWFDWNVNIFDSSSLCGSHNRIFKIVDFLDWNIRWTAPEVVPRPIWLDFQDFQTVLWSQSPFEPSKFDNRRLGCSLWIDPNLNAKVNKSINHVSSASSWFSFINILMLPRIDFPTSITQRFGLNPKFPSFCDWIQQFPLTNEPHLKIIHPAVLSLALASY